MNCRILEGSSPLRASSTVTKMLRTGAEQRPLKAKSREKRQDRHSRKKCEGGRFYYDLERRLPSTDHRRSNNLQRNKTKSHYVAYVKTNGGRERVIICHNHPQGPCDMVFHDRYDGKLTRYDHRYGNDRLEFHEVQTHLDGDEDCCATCIIL